YAISGNRMATSITVLAAGLLYFADAALNRHSRELALAALVSALGLSLLLERLQTPYDVDTLLVALLTAGYLFAALAVERTRSAIFTQRFLQPLYAAAHML